MLIGLAYALTSLYNDMTLIADFVHYPAMTTDKTPPSLISFPAMQRVHD